MPRWTSRPVLFLPAGSTPYEQQQRLFNPVDRPLAQPYAAFSAGEAITIAIENLIGKYLGGRLAEAVSGAERAKAEAARAARRGRGDREVLRGGSRTSEAPVNLHEVKL